MRRHAVAGLESDPKYCTNFLGVRIDPKFFPTILAARVGEVEGVPIPANWHADIAEWGAALRAVDLAMSPFTVIELGCGWGCWLNMTGAAARRAGRKVKLIGVEGDPTHIQFAREAVSANGFDSADVTLHRGIAATKPGMALFPRQSGSNSWGLEPIFCATAAQRHKAMKSGDYDELPMISLEELTSRQSRIDLLHIDIQGGEADLVGGSLDVLHERVAYMVIGTHSRQIEGSLFDTLLGGGWILEIERPSILSLESGMPVVHVDGVQGWRNPELLPYD